MPDPGQGTECKPLVSLKMLCLKKKKKFLANRARSICNSSAGKEEQLDQPWMGLDVCNHRGLRSVSRTDFSTSFEAPYPSPHFYSSELQLFSLIYGSQSK